MALCVVCQKTLILHVEAEDKEDDLSDVTEEYDIDDDVHLTCNCHFHWQCLLDSSYEVTSCPNCKANVISIDSSGNQQLLCDLNNEGGLQQGQDILQILVEESFLRAYPEERKARAFLEFCAEGDVDAIVEILSSGDDLNTDEGDAANNAIEFQDHILRYQDQLGSMNSALHLAVLNQRVEVAWLLLLLGSNVPYTAFPEEVRSAARDVGISRTSQIDTVDIRSLKDAEGLTAFDRARDLGAGWETWITEGIFIKEPLLKAP